MKGRARQSTTWARISPSIALLKNKQLPKNMRMMEIGCGEGGVLLEIATALNTTELYGVDVNGEALKKAAGKGITVSKVDLNVDCLSFPDGFFDVVLMEEVIEHLVNPDNSVQEVYRVLRFGGYFLVTTPNLAWWLNRLILLLGYQPYWTECSVRYNVGKFKSPLAEHLSARTHLTAYSLKALKELLQSYRFKIICAKGITSNNLPSIFEYVNRLLSRLSGLSEIVIVLAQK
jgi:methionine biosynthesis protein MetW